MYNYSITYQDTTQPNVVYKGYNINADNIMDCFLAFNKLHPTGFIHGVKLNDLV